MHHWNYLLAAAQDKFRLKNFFLWCCCFFWLYESSSTIIEINLTVKKIWVGSCWRNFVQSKNLLKCKTDWLTDFFLPATMLGLLFKGIKVDAGFFFSVKKSPSIKIDMSIWILVGRIEEKPFDNRKNSTENKAEICLNFSSKKNVQIWWLFYWLSE